MIEIQPVTTFLMKFVTPEVITVFGALAAAWAGWKIAAKGIGLVGALAQRVSFVGMVAAILFMSGIGITGVGAGDVASRMSSSETKGMSNNDLLNLASRCNDKEIFKSITEYARVRDGDKTENDRILAALVEKSQQSGDKDNKALVAYMEYLKSKENTNARKTEVASLVFANTEIPADVVEVKKEPKQTMFSLPVSFGMIGVGIASAICGISFWRRKSGNAKIETLGNSSYF